MGPYAKLKYNERTSITDESFKILPEYLYKTALKQDPRNSLFLQSLRENACGTSNEATA